VLSTYFRQFFPFRGKRGSFPQGILTAAIFHGVELSAVRRQWWEGARERLGIAELSLGRLKG